MLCSSLRVRFSIRAAFGLGLLILTSFPAHSEVEPAVTNSLSTKVNGSLNESCRSGICKISGGTPSGKNLFHRFKEFDTRGGIEGVEFDSAGKKNLIIAVTSSKGSFLNKPISLRESSNLLLLD